MAPGNWQKLLSATSPGCLELTNSLACNMAASGSESSLSRPDVTITAVLSQPSLHLGRRASWWMRAGNCRSHCTWGRHAIWWMRCVDVPGPKYNIGQDPSRTTTQTTPTATITKGLCLTTTMTLTDDRRLLRTVIAAAVWSCRMVFSSVCRAIVFSSRPLSLSLSLAVSLSLSLSLSRSPLSLSLSLSLPLSALGPPGQAQSLRLPDHSVGLAQCQEPSTISARTQAERRRKRRRRPLSLLQCGADFSPRQGGVCV